VASTPPGYTGSDASFVQATRWLQNCTQYHKICGPDVKHSLPTRVIDVSSFSGVKVYETRQEEGRYVCLSHCWGTSRPACISTTETILTNKLSIPWGLLPQTFKDAIVITRKLGIQYLWIDSVCIIQNDPADWEQESSRMAEVYQKAILTLVATKSIDDDGGLFSNLRPQFEPHQLHLTVGANTPLPVYVRRALPHWSDWTEDSWPPTQNTAQHSSKDNFPLLHRAWTYQERLLSPRLLHFTSDELMWECMETSSCECSPPGANWDSLRRRYPPKKEHANVTYRISLSDPAAGALTPFLAFRPILSPAQRWRNMVNEYSSLDLTLAKDKLPALSGAAKQMQQCRKNERYLAGLWEGTLVWDLLWYVGLINVSARKARRPAQWRAPSWSWASVDSPVRYVYEEIVEGSVESSVRWVIDDAVVSDKVLANILKVECTPSGRDPTGELSSGSIVLCGLLAPATLNYKKRGGDWDFTAYDITVGKLPLFEMCADYPLHEGGKDKIGDGARVYCLRVASSYDRKLISLAFNHCLILRQVDAGAKKYERIGIAGPGWQSLEIHSRFEEVEEKSIITLI
jgi:hypothetical protein